MNKGEKRRFEEKISSMTLELKNSPFLRTGLNRGESAKESNYIEVKDLLQAERMKTTQGDVHQAAEIIAKVLGRRLEIQAPPRDNGAAKRLAAMERDATTVELVKPIDDNGVVNVRLDIDQNKHQHRLVPIGTRMKGGGNRFVQACNENWHKLTTLEHMAEWAKDLGGMQQGQVIFHGQATPVNGIHYEGYCLQAGDNKYVLFHCYPSDTSDLKL